MEPAALRSASQCHPGVVDLYCSAHPIACHSRIRLTPSLLREVVEGWVQIGPQCRSPVVLYSLPVACEETSPGRKMLVTRTMNGVCHLQTDFGCPHAPGGAVSQ